MYSSAPVWESSTAGGICWLWMMSSFYLLLTNENEWFYHVMGELIVVKQW